MKPAVHKRKSYDSLNSSRPIPELDSATLSVSFLYHSQSSLNAVLGKTADIFHLQRWLFVPIEPKLERQLAAVTSTQSGIHVVASKQQATDDK